jgi:hypothetical protein
MNKDQIALGVFGFSVAVIVVLLVLAFSQNIRMSGRAVQEIGGGQASASLGEITCSDSDGRNYDIKGVLNYCDENGCIANEDSCNGRMLIEWYCENNDKKYEERLCEYTCDDGICLGYVTKFSYPYAGGGGGGGDSSTGSSGGAAASVNIRDLGDLTSETTLEIIDNENIRFAIGGRSYLLILKGHSETEARLITGSDDFTLGIGGDRKIDLSGDSVPDLYIFLRSVNVLTGKVKITLDLA